MRRCVQDHAQSLPAWRSRLRPRGPGPQPRRGHGCQVARARGRLRPRTCRRRQATAVPTLNDYGSGVDRARRHATVLAIHDGCRGLLTRWSEWWLLTRQRWVCGYPCAATYDVRRSGYGAVQRRASRLPAVAGARNDDRVDRTQPCRLDRPVHGLRGAMQRRPNRGHGKWDTDGASAHRFTGDADRTSGGRITEGFITLANADNVLAAPAVVRSLHETACVPATWSRRWYRAL